MPTLIVRGLSPREWGRPLIRINELYRDGIPRWGVAKLTNVYNGKSIDCLVLGHDTKGAIFMAFDMRAALDVELGAAVDFHLERLGWWGKLRWYVMALDPAVHVPAWLALWSLVLGAAGLILAIISLWRGTR